jgi:hypothetical protein
MNTRLEEIEKRLSEATPGPWGILLKGFGPKVGNRDVDQHMAEFPYHDDIAIAVVDKYNLPIEMKHIAESNAQLIAHAPADLRFLIDEVKRLADENTTNFERSVSWFEKFDACSKERDQLEEEVKRLKGLQVDHLDDMRRIQDAERENDQLKTRVEKLEAVLKETDRLLEGLASGREMNHNDLVAAFNQAKRYSWQIQIEIRKALADEGGGE